MNGLSGGRDQSWALGGDCPLKMHRQPAEGVPYKRACPAGESLVKTSVAFIDKGGSLGYAGFPAVMGSKNLKAIEPVSKRSSLFKVKEGENFNRRNTFPYFED